MSKVWALLILVVAGYAVATWGEPLAKTQIEAARAAHRAPQEAIESMLPAAASDAVAEEDK